MRTEKATLISTTSGMPLAPVAARIRPFSDRHEADDLAHRVAPRHHHQQAEQDDGERERQVLARQRSGFGGDAQHDRDRQRDEADAGQHGRADADDRLDRRDECRAATMMRCSATGMMMRLEDERDRGRDVEVRRVLDVGLPADREGETRTRAARRH